MLTGHCLCGGVQFEISEPLQTAYYCHCTRCQRRSGTAASAQAVISPGSLTFTAGEELLRDYIPPTGGFIKVFCSACGSAIMSRNPENADFGVVRLGAIDGDPGVRPSFRNRVETAAVWESIPDDGLPRYVSPDE